MTTTPESTTSRRSLTVKSPPGNSVLMMQDVEEPHLVTLYCKDKHIQVNMSTNTMEVLEQLQDLTITTPASAIAPEVQSIDEQDIDDSVSPSHTHNTADTAILLGTPASTRPEEKHELTEDATSEDDSDEDSVDTARAARAKVKFAEISERRNAHLKDLRDDLKKAREEEGSSHMLSAVKEVSDSEGDDEVDRSPLEKQGSTMETHTLPSTKPLTLDDLLVKKEPEVVHDPFAEPSKASQGAVNLREHNKKKMKQVRAYWIGNSDQAFFQRPKYVGTYESMTACGNILGLTASEISRVCNGHRNYCTSAGKRYGFTTDMHGEYALPDIPIGPNDKPKQFNKKPVKTSTKPVKAKAFEKRPPIVRAAAKEPRKEFTRDREVMKNVSSSSGHATSMAPPPAPSENKRKRPSIEDTSPDTDELADQLGELLESDRASSKASSKSNSSGSSFGKTITKKQKAFSDGDNLTPRPHTDRPLIPTDLYKPPELTEEEKKAKMIAKQKKAMDMEYHYTPGIIMNDNGFGNTCMGHKKKEDISIPVVGECGHINCMSCVMAFAQKNRVAPKCLMCNTQWMSWKCIPVEVDHYK